MKNFFSSKIFLSLWKILWICSTADCLTSDLDETLKLSNTSLGLAKILDGYDVRLRPNFGADPLYVGIEIQIAEINAFSEVNMDYTVTIFLNQYWKDERLAFSTGEDRLTFTGDFAKRIWVPDIFFPADKDSFIHDVTQRNQMVQLSGDGSILYGMKFTTRESCQMDLRNFPLDSQNCTVEIESYGYTVKDVVMYWKDNAVSGVEAIRLPQLRIGGYDTNDRIERLATGIYQRLSLSFKFERRFGYFFFQMYLPAILIVMLSWISFWISNDATAARVALGITTVLTMTTINNSVRNSLPRISFAAIDVYLVTCFLFVFAALIEYAAVNYIFWEQKKPKPKNAKSKPPKICTISNRLKGMSNVFRKKRKERQVQKFQKEQKVQVSIEEKSEPAENLRSGRMRSFSFSGAISVEKCVRRKRNQGVVRMGIAQSRIWQNLKTRVQSPMVQDVSSVDNYSRVLFPLTFCIFNAFYWTIYRNKS